jgi:hypothetical protein
MRVKKPKTLGYLGPAVALLMGVPAWAAAADATVAPQWMQPAVWTPKELTFIYQGFTSRYSCEGLRDKVRRALLALGARADLSVTASGCTSPDGRPDPFPGVRIKMNVLAAAPDAQTAANGDSAAVVGADWKRVDLRLNTDPLAEAGDCELIEQIKSKILPQFSTRNVDFSSHCVPHQLSPGGTWLRADVLMAAPKDDKGLASK